MSLSLMFLCALCTWSFLLSTYHQVETRLFLPSRGMIFNWCPFAKMAVGWCSHFYLRTVRCRFLCFSGCGSSRGSGCPLTFTELQVCFRSLECLCPMHASQDQSTDTSKETCKHREFGCVWDHLSERDSYIQGS